MKIDDAYLQLEKAIFEDNALKTMPLNKLAEKLGLNYVSALENYSHMLKNHNKEVPEPEPICPTCGKPKALLPGNACRDYFHIV